MRSQRLFNSGAYACTQRQMQLASTIRTPFDYELGGRACRRADIGGNQRTHKTITAPGKWRLEGMLA